MPCELSPVRARSTPTICSPWASKIAEPLRPPAGTGTKAQLAVVTFQQVSFPAGRPRRHRAADRGEHGAGRQDVIAGAKGMAAGNTPSSDVAATATMAASAVSERFNTRPATGCDWCPCRQNSHCTVVVPSTTWAAVIT